ncbi:uncharacterized protein LOC119670740 [Teleopsis dalmanni]|uniref:uncharacterized protein LOC119670740 n=1 Tax=Teleopsis dalmanni TaxID=139649 RepID=UPI0018CFD967|nr:uncharacterized protein LOC119670740 [Teleopsis dalmanni]
MDLILKYKKLWLLLNLYIIFVEINLIRADPQPESSLLDVGLGVITVAGSAFETLQNGMIVTRDHGFNTSLLSVHSKSTAGMGNAVVKRKASNEEIDDWRKKRTIVAPDHNDLLMKHEVKHRKKRSPCYYGRPPSGGNIPSGGNLPSGGNPTPTEPTDDEEARRRIVRMLRQRRRNVLQGRSRKRSGSRTRGRR